MSNIQSTMTDAEKLEFRNKNRLSVFCEHSRLEFFRRWCKLNGKTCTRDCAKCCPNYTPTLEDK